MGKYPTLHVLQALQLSRFAHATHMAPCPASTLPLFARPGSVTARSVTVSANSPSPQHSHVAAAAPGATAATVYSALHCAQPVAFA